MSNRLRNLIILAVVVIVIAGFVRVLSTGPAGNSVVSASAEEVTVIERGDVLILVSATGPIQAKQNAALAFSSMGKVVSINVKEGDYILKGQTIATLDAQLALDAVTMAQARINAQQIVLRRLTEKPRQVDINVFKAALNVAKAALTSAKSGPDKLQVAIANYNVEIAKNQLWQVELQRDADRKQRDDLLNNPYTANSAGSLPSEDQHDTIITSKDYGVKVQEAQLADSKSNYGDPGSIAAAEAQIVAAEIALDKLMEGGDKDDVAQANARVQAAQAALDQAKADLAKAKLVAPFDGVVAKINLHLGEQAPLSNAVTMLDTSSYYVDLAVDEKDISKVTLGQAANLTFDALPRVVLNGKVTQIAQTATKSGDTVTYTVRVEIDPAGQSLLATMSTTAKITVGQVNNAIRVRNRFVRLDRSTGKAFANVRQPDGKYKEVEIVLGLRNDTYSEVKSGLSVGDTIGLVQTDSTFRPPI